MTISAALTKELPSTVNLRPVDGGRYEMDVAGIRFVIANDKELTEILQKYKQLVESRGGDFLTGTFKLFGNSGMISEVRAKENMRTGFLLLAIGRVKGESVASQLLIDPIHAAFKGEPAKLNNK